MQVGDHIRLKRRNSPLNGWSCHESLDGAIAEIIEIEDRVNGAITLIYNGEKLLIFQDAIGEVIPKGERHEK